MRKPYAITFIFTIIFAGIYMYTQVSAVCRVPISYSIGNVDKRFGITNDEIRVATADAESVWEQATGRNLFNYDPQSDFEINFVYDDRQAFADKEIHLRESLDSTIGVNNSIEKEYANLVGRYDSLEKQYKNKVKLYKNKLATYNKKVQKYNIEGGAPTSVYDELQDEKKVLDEEIQSVNELGDQLNSLSDEINKLSDEGNKLIETYNSKVEKYNKTFGDTREFTQGDYQGDKINIYKFENMTELELVLAHEFGHALSLDHVKDITSIMNDHLGQQPDTLKLTESDLNEFTRVCGEKSFNTSVQDSWRNFINFF